MPKIRIYTQSINPFTAKVELALALKGLPYEREVSDDPDDLKRWSPVTRQLPVADIDGERIHDSGAIVRELETRFPASPLLATDPKTARAQERLAEWSDSFLLFYWNRWREARYPRPGDEMPADNLRRSSNFTVTQRLSFSACHEAVWFWPPKSRAHSNSL